MWAVCVGQSPSSCPIRAVGQEMTIMLLQLFFCKRRQPRQTETVDVDEMPAKLKLESRSSRSEPAGVEREDSSLKCSEAIRS